MFKMFSLEGALTKADPLEEAAKRGQLQLERDKKSGGHIASSTNKSG